MKFQGWRFIGFSVIEILITLSIIGIILAFALPNYNNHIVQERRLMAETTLMKLAGHMEAYFAEHNSYEGANFQSLHLPEFTEGKHYQLAINATTTQFKLTAQPQEQQARHDSRCGSLILNSNGVKRITGFGTLNECW